MSLSTDNTVYVILCSGHSGSRLLVRLLAENGVYMGARRGAVGEDNQDFGEPLWADTFRRQVVAYWKYPADLRLIEPIRTRLLRAHQKFIGGMAELASPPVAVGTKNATQFPYLAEHYRAALGEHGLKVRFIHLTRDPRMWMLSGREPNSRGIVRPARHPRFSLFDDPFNRYVWTGSFSDEVVTPIGTITLSDFAVYNEDEQIALEAKLWATANTIAGKFARYTDDYLHVRYEDLILEPAVVFARLSAFMGVSLTHEPPSGTRIRTDRVQQNPVEVVGEHDADLIAQTCGELMDRFGYVRDGSNVGPLETNGSTTPVDVQVKSTVRTLNGQNAHDLRPVFVVGCMRSGTTILGKLLDSHPDLKQIGWEMNDEWTTLGYAPSGLVCESRDAADATPEATRAMHDFFISKLGSRSSRVRPVNKSPHLGNKIAYVRALFPDAQFVHIVRDPFSHSNSMKSHFERITNQQRQSVAYWPESSDRPCWQQFTVQRAAEQNLDYDRIYPGEGFLRIPEAWSVINAYISETLEALPEGVATAISYNNLVRDPTSEMARLYAFLGQDTQPAALAPMQMNGSIGLVNSQTRDPLNDWRDTLTPALVNEIESQLNAHADQLNQIERWLNQSYGSDTMSVLPVATEVPHEQ